MNYDKKVCVLKQIESGYSVANKTLGGIVSVERENENFTLNLSLINFYALDGGEYYFYLTDGEDGFYAFNMGVLPRYNSLAVESFCLKNGFSCGVAVVKNNIPLLVAYAKTSECNVSVSELKKSIFNYHASLTPKQAYNDEAVATENYYEFDSDSISAEGFDNTVTIDSPTTANDDEEDSEEFNEFNPFFVKEKDELENLFNKFPIDYGLTSLFPDSKWVKINYAVDKYYLVGVVKENGKEKYICYGVPAKYKEKAPAEISEYCSFIPLSLFDLTGDGYFIMFQDAVTGKCIKK